ncbi:hypothetical protein N7537_003089 [Penicillium hordei]|uniref:Myb-like DNA-binding domain-containing protein n=1 Tax=Penicillium hordei TaxID=40994 RepID=A0AAD6H9D2_9EURO|nr:uncharacterized protein N7537_003089 [Penicillium hordei]KAJ5617975.1 hypothetical protein N7537_003089 [Penicillium hordei]
MASNKVSKAKATKKAVAKPSPKRAKGAPEIGRDIMEERLEFLLTCLKETGIKINYAAVGQHYGISANAAYLRFLRSKDHVAKLVSAREAARKSDAALKDDEDLEITEDEEA